MVMGSPDAIHPPTTPPVSPMSSAVAAAAAPAAAALAAAGSTACPGCVGTAGDGAKARYQPLVTAPPRLARATRITVPIRKVIAPWSIAGAARRIPATRPALQPPMTKQTQEPKTAKTRAARPNHTDHVN